MNYIEIIKKLIGPINPVGDSHIDAERFENLKYMCEMVDKLVQEIDNVHYRYKDDNEASIKLMADYADNFMSNTLGIKE